MLRLPRIALGQMSTPAIACTQRGRLGVGTKSLDDLPMASIMAQKTQTDSKSSFGFDPSESTHHFLVMIPRSATGDIEISEHFSWAAAGGSSEVTTGTRQDGQIRVVLARLKWDAIADEVRAEFNRSLRQRGHKPGGWKVGRNPVRRELGKELLLLAWAIEDADPSLIPNALANWKGLVAEERWWLYTQTAAATGHGITDRNKGWRKAVRYALTENPVHSRTGSEAVVPEYFRLANVGPLFGGDVEDQ